MATKDLTTTELRGASLPMLLTLAKLLATECDRVRNDPMRFLRIVRVEAMVRSEMLRRPL